MRVVALLVLTLVTAGFAGCLGGDEGSASSEDPEAPLGPKQLRVGKALVGDYIRIAVNSTGHTVEYDYDGRDFQESIKELNDRDYIERRVAEVVGRDRYWNEFPAIQYQMRMTDLDPEQGQTGVYTQQTTYRKSDRYGVYDDVQTSIPVSSTTCTPQGCQTERSTEQVDFRYYHRTPTPVDALSLAGQVLTLGKTTSLQHTWTDRLGYIHQQWANYTAKREVIVNGERTFVVEPKFESRILNPDPSEKPEVGASSTSEPSASKTENKKRPPKPVREYYMSARMSVPLKQVANMPFEYDDRYYWYNITYEVEAFEAGSAPVVWGSEPAPDLNRNGTLPFKQFREKLAFKELTYPFSQAWKNMRADPTLVEFNRVAAAPDALPVRASYFPDGGRNAYTWQMIVIGETGGGANAESRLQGVAGVPGVYVPQDRESQGRFGGIRPLSGDRISKTNFADPETLYSTFRQVRPGTWQPTVQFTLYEIADFDWMEASVVFGNPSGARTQTFNPIFGIEVLRGRDTISLSLLDGGLEGINTTGFFFANSMLFFPFGVPVPPQQAQLDQDMRLVAGFERPWTLPVQVNA